MSDTFTWQMCLEQGGHRYTEAGICRDCMALAGNCIDSPLLPQGLSRLP